MIITAWLTTKVYHMPKAIPSFRLLSQHKEMLRLSLTQYELCRQLRNHTFIHLCMTVGPPCQSQDWRCLNLRHMTTSGLNNTERAVCPTPAFLVPVLVHA